MVEYHERPTVIEGPFLGKMCLKAIYVVARVEHTDRFRAICKFP